MQHLFVYGTLRKGGLSHHLLQGAPLIKTSIWLEGYCLYGAGWYPFAVKEAGGKILGDVVAVQESLWPDLDVYEGEAYERVFLEVQNVWLYVFKGNPASFPKVESGDWLSWWGRIKS